ncbi:alpha/beta hydrolase [Streptomyces sp. NPDC058045]|uniref:alpha/beta hydrolase n=1 Tax=Streptomyces sp. NPDC058045 TaxID=3346311 RepID=UPI0036DFD45E
MGLTSTALLGLAAALAGLLFGGTVWLWPRFAGRGWRWIAARTGVLLAAQAALFCTLLLAANQNFGFYGSWSDLLGTETGQGVVVDQTARGPLRLLGTEPVSAASPSAPSAGGQIQRIRITGAVSRISSPALLYLPPEYFQQRYRQHTFPAAVVLTGYPGTAAALVNGLHYPQTAQRLVRGSRMPPMVLVMMRPTVVPPRDTECVDVPGGPQTETFLAEDVPRAVAGHYRVARAPHSWGVIGDSTGGYCALKLAVHHPGRYAAGAGLSPYYKAPEDPTTGDLFRGDQSARNHADLMWSMRHGPAPRTSLLVTTSRHGERNYRATRAFVNLVRHRGPTRISSIVLDTGGHNFNTWRREIPAALEWLGGRLSGG